ncbi:MAG: alpha/beta fold hydrolase [Chloroflexi bacterium]|nr:alpha/beta fold hydrolase [Chloroflexota bacterium]
MGPRPGAGLDRRIVLRAALFLAVALTACAPAAPPAATPVAISVAATPIPSPTPPAPTPMPAWIRTADGVTLEGTIFSPREPRPGPRTAVILAHMYPADQTGWRPFAAELADTQGLTAMTFNFRGYGLSQGSKEIARIDLDLEAALDTVRPFAEQFFLVGASMGGTAAVLVAARREMAGIAALSAPGTFMGLDAAPAVRQVTEPTLFIAAEGDDGTPAAARWYADNVGGRVGLLLVPGTEHGTYLLEGPSRERVKEALLSFLRDPSAVAR